MTMHVVVPCFSTCTFVLLWMSWHGLLYAPYHLDDATLPTHHGGRLCNLDSVALLNLPCSSMRNRGYLRVRVC